MRLTPTELDRLTIFTAAELARRRRAKGWRLTYPEALALICDEMHEAARGGASYEEVVAAARSVLTEDDVLEGVADLVGYGQARVPVRGRHPDPPRGAADRTGHGRGRHEAGRDPVRRGRDSAERRPAHGRGRRVTNTSDHTIFISSHFPFFEVNRRLVFDRARAWGMHLDVPAGDSVRWRPGETRTVRLVAYGGQRTRARLQPADRRPRHPRPARRGPGARARGRLRPPGGRRAGGRLMAGELSRPEYSARYGPTAGDRVRLGDTDLLARIERDESSYGDEVLRGWAKTLRTGIMMSAELPAASELDLIVTQRDRDGSRARRVQGEHRREGRGDRRHGPGRQSGRGRQSRSPHRLEHRAGLRAGVHRDARRRSTRTSTWSSPASSRRRWPRG